MKKEKIISRVLSLLLVLCMVLTPVSSLQVWATEDDEETSDVQPQNEDEEEEDEEDNTEESGSQNDDDDEEEDSGNGDDEDDEDDEEDETPAEKVHVHDFRYKLNDSRDTLTVTCIEEDCDIDGSKISVKLSVEDKVYDGAAAKVTVQNESAFKEATDGSCSLQLIRGGGNVSNAVNCGEYTAQVTLKAEGDEYVLKKDFKISQRPLTISGISVKDKVYDGTDIAELDLSKMTINGRASGDALTVEVGKATFPTADVGVHTVTLEGLRITGSGIDNYKLDIAAQAKVEFVEITRRDISDAEVVLGPALFYNGKNQTQTIESVTLPAEDGKEQLEVTYSVRDNTAHDEGTYTLSITGTGNFSGSVTKDFRLLPAAGQIMGSKMKYGDGSLALEMQENDLGITMLSGLEDAVKLLSAERLSAVAEGDNVAWNVRVERTEPNSVQRQVMSDAAGGRELVGSGFTFTLTETVNGASETLNNSTFRPKVTMTVPEDVKKVDSASIILLRCVAGEGGKYIAGPVEMTYNSKDNVFSFAADCDSTYMLATKTASAGGKILVVIMIVVMVFSAAALGVLLYLKFRNRDEDDDDYDEDDFNLMYFLKSKLAKNNTVGDERITQPLPRVPEKPVAKPVPEEKLPEIDLDEEFPVEALYAAGTPKTIAEPEIRMETVDDDIDLEELEKLLDMKDDELNR